MPSATGAGPYRTDSRVVDLVDAHAVSAGQLGVVRLRAPVEAATRRIGRPRERDAEHDGIRPHRERLDDVARGAHAAVGDHVDVASARLVEVVAARAGDVGDRCRHRGMDAEGGARGGCRSPAEADENARRTGAHEVQRGGVGRGAADDDGHVEVVDELLEVQRLVDRRHVLGRHRRAADDEQVDAGRDDGLVQLLRALRREGTGDGDPAGADLGEAIAHELGLDRLGVQLLHAAASPWRHRARRSRRGSGSGSS